MNSQDTEGAGIPPTSPSIPIFPLVAMASKKKRVVRKMKTSIVNPIETIVSPVSTEKEQTIPSDIPIRHHRRASLGP